jgi:hypothetical protein
MNLLFLAFEGEAHLMGRLALHFRSEGHRVLVACCDHFNVTHRRSDTHNLLAEAGLLANELADLREVYENLNSFPEDLGDSEVDWDYLKRFEERFCQRFTLLEIAMMDPLMSDAYHHRKIYYHPHNKALFFKNLELHLKWIEEKFDRNGCDAVITINFQYFVKAVAFKVAQSRGIPYLMISSSRIEDVYLAFDNFSIGTPTNILKEMKRLEGVGDPCVGAHSFIQRIKEQHSPSYYDFENTLRDLKLRFSLKARLSELWRFLTRYSWAAIFVNCHYRGLLRPNYFLPTYFQSLRVMLVSIWRRIAYFRTPSLMREDLPDGPFVYFALHLIPENSILTLSRTFDEFECLFQLAKSLPVHWKVVVKINPNMLADYDTHPNHYYRAMCRLPNVQMIGPLISSATIIERASAVAAITGTVLLEGAIFGKPGFRWGNTEFDALDMVVLFDRDTVNEHLRRPPSRNLHFYVQSCMNLGIRLDFRLLQFPVNVPIPTDKKTEHDTQISDVIRCLSNALNSRVPSC